MGPVIFRQLVSPAKTPGTPIHRRKPRGEFEQKETKLTKVRHLPSGRLFLQDTVTPGRNLKKGFAEATPLFPL